MTDMAARRWDKQGPGARALWVMAAVGIAGLAAAMVWRGVHAPESQLFARSVYRGPGRRRSVALTFDDGPSEGTPALLELLAAEGIRATFFQCGMNVERLPGVARAVREAGHEIANHTFSHARLPPRLSRKPNLLTPADIAWELRRAQGSLQRVSGVVPTLFRAPYGMRWFGLGRAQRRLNLLGVLWTVIGHDWEWTAEAVAAHVLQGAGPGGIVCLHDGRDIRPQVDLSEMLGALRVIIPALRAQGYRFETVTELLRPDAVAT